LTILAISHVTKKPVCQYLQLSNYLKYCDMLMTYKMQRVRQEKVGFNMQGRGEGFVIGNKKCYCRGCHWR